MRIAVDVNLYVLSGLKSRALRGAIPQRNQHVALFRLDISYIKALDHPMLLHSLPQRETVHLTRCRLEDIQSSIQHHLPASVRGDVVLRLFVVKTCSTMKPNAAFTPGLRHRKSPGFC